MQFPVPQFIDRETKILGPMSFKQAVMMLGGLAICGALYLVFAKKNFFVFIILALPVLAFSIAMTFGQIQGRSLVSVSGNAASFMFRTKYFLWQKKAIRPQIYKPKMPEKKEVKKRSRIKTKRRGDQLQSLSTFLQVGEKE